MEMILLIPEQSFMAEVEKELYTIKWMRKRAKAGVSSLTYNDVMQKYARIKSKTWEIVIILVMKI